MILLKSEAIQSQKTGVDIITGASQFFIDSMPDNNEYEPSIQFDKSNQ